MKRKKLTKREVIGYSIMLISGVAIVGSCTLLYTWIKNLHSILSIIGLEIIELDVVNAEKMQYLPIIIAIAIIGILAGVLLVYENEKTE